MEQHSWFQLHSKCYVFLETAPVKIEQSIPEICATQVADNRQYGCSIGNEVRNTRAGFEVSVIAGGGERCINNIVMINGPEVIVLINVWGRLLDIPLKPGIL